MFKIFTVFMSGVLTLAFPPLAFFTVPAGVICLAQIHDRRCARREAVAVIAALEAEAGRRKMLRLL